MRELRDTTKTAFIEHAERDYPREACGLVIVRRGREVYWPCRNLAYENEQFIMSPEDYADADAEGEVLAVLHSHPAESALPSQPDMVACEASGAPWWIYSVPDRAWHYLEPSGYVAPLIGREYAFGVLDCYTLARDYYASECGIVIPDFPRITYDAPDVLNVYVEKFAEFGFYEVPFSDIQKHDGILMRLDERLPHHGAVYLGDGMILHHVANRLSSRDYYTEFFQQRTTHVLRYGNGSTPR